MINRKRVLKAATVLWIAVLSAQTLLGGLVSSTPSMKEYAKGGEKLVVYTDVPGHDLIINGQMDDHNAAFPSTTPGGAMKGNPPVHTVSLFANPLIEKPMPSGPGIRVVTAGVFPPTDTNYTTMVFGPGVHNLGPGFNVHPGKSYYIPGDALVFGSLDNSSVEQGRFRCNGDRITIYGYGKLQHPD